MSSRRIPLLSVFLFGSLALTAQETFVRGDTNNDGSSTSPASPSPALDPDPASETLAVLFLQLTSIPSLDLTTLAVEFLVFCLLLFTWSDNFY